MKETHSILLKIFEKCVKTVLDIMIQYLYGKPKFLIKVIPVIKLNSEFLYEKVTNIVNLINHLNTIQLQLCDNNGINQIFYSRNVTLDN